MLWVIVGLQCYTMLYMQCRSCLRRQSSESVDGRCWDEAWCVFNGSGEVDEPLPPCLAAFWSFWVILLNLIVCILADLWTCSTCFISRHFHPNDPNWLQMAADGHRWPQASGSKDGRDTKSCIASCEVGTFWITWCLQFATNQTLATQNPWLSFSFPTKIDDWGVWICLNILDSLDKSFLSGNIQICRSSFVARPGGVQWRAAVWLAT